MQKFIVDGVGRSGTTAIAKGLNNHPHIFCAIEQVNDYANHRGLLDSPKRLLKINAAHRENNAKVFAGKDIANLTAFGNKYPGYFHRWDDILDEIGDAPKAVVMIREPRGILSSWSQRIRAGSFPAGMISAYAAFDILELINQTTKSQAADRTLFVSFATLLTGNRCAEVFEKVVDFLGVPIDPQATQAFLKFQANTQYVATKPKAPLSDTEAALALTLPMADLLHEVDREGCILASQSLGQDVVKTALAGAQQIMDQFEVCLSEHPQARGDLPYYVGRRSAVKEPVVGQVASASSSPLATFISQYVAMPTEKYRRQAPPASERTALARLKKNLRWKKLLRWEKIFPR